MNTPHVTNSAPAGSELPFTTVTAGALSPKLPPYQGGSSCPAVPIVTAHGGTWVASGALTSPKLPPYQGD